MLDFFLYFNYFLPFLTADFHLYGIGGKIIRRRSDLQNNIDNRTRDYNGLNDAIPIVDGEASLSGIFAAMKKSMKYNFL